MTILPFTLRQLEVFASLASSGSFRASADMLGISQASVSNQLKALEEQLGVRLFARTPGRSPRLTPEGLAFREDLHAFNAAAQNLASHRRSEPVGALPMRFRLLVGQGMFDAYVRHKLDRFSAENPMIELEFETRPPSDSLSGAIRDLACDFALINLRADIEQNPVFKRLARVRGGIYGHSKFAEGRSLPLSAETISGLPFILPLAGSRQEAEVLKSLGKAGVRPAKVVGHTQYYDVMAAMVDRGIAVASLSDAILPVSMRETVVRLMPLSDWHLVMFRRQGIYDPRAEIVERFLIDSVLGDPTYPATELYGRESD